MGYVTPSDGSQRLLGTTNGVSRGVESTVAATTAQNGESLRRRQVRPLIWIGLLALGFNVFSWIGVRLWPDTSRNGVWTVVSLLGAFLIGALIGRSWALLVTLAFVVIHAIPVYLKLSPGYLSTW